MIRPAPRLLAAVLAVLALVLGSAAVAASASARTGSSGGYVVPKAVCGDAAKGHARCFAQRLVRASKSTPGARLRPAIASAAVPAGPAGGYTPAALSRAYGINSAVATNVVVGIVDAFDNPNVRDDLNAFDAQYGLPAETADSLVQVSQTGSATLPAGNDEGWAGETSLDVQAVRGICHTCKILLVEADNDLGANLAAAEDTAAAGADIVSNSFGIAEGYGGGNAGFAEAFDKPGKVILASTGDDGMYDWDYSNADPNSADYDVSAESPESPSSLNTVVAVGGTSLELDAAGNRASETVWNTNGAGDDLGYYYGAPLGATGGGCSTLFPARSWQLHVAGYNQTGCGANRLAADVSALGDPQTGFDTYNSYHPSDPTQANWGTFGGTSLSSPLIAGMWALAGGSRGIDYPARLLYGHQADPSARYDVTAGGNGFCGGESVSACYDEYGQSPNTVGYGTIDCAWQAYSEVRSVGTRACTAAAGYDGPSGVGTPRGTRLFQPSLPTARLTPTTAVHATVNTRYTAAGSASAYPGAALTSYSWSWGDHTSSVGGAPVHRYARVGVYTVALTVRDVYGYSATTARKVVVTSASRTTQRLSPARVHAKKRAKLTVRVTSPGATTAGTVSVYDGRRRVARVALRASAHGSVKITLPKLKKGKHSIHAVFTGAAYIAGSSARSSRLTVVR